MTIMNKEQMDIEQAGQMDPDIRSLRDYVAEHFSNAFIVVTDESMTVYFRTEGLQTKIPKNVLSVILEKVHRQGSEAEYMESLEPDWGFDARAAELAPGDESGVPIILRRVAGAEDITGPWIAREVTINGTKVVEFSREKREKPKAA